MCVCVCAIIPKVCLPSCSPNAILVLEQTGSCDSPENMGVTQTEREHVQVSQSKAVLNPDKMPNLNGRPASEDLDGRARS